MRYFYTDSLEFVQSSRGKRMIQYGIHRYSEHTWNGGRLTGPKKRWRCNGKIKGCKAHIITVDDIVVHFYNNHNH